MATVRMEGTLDIDLVDVWAWIEARGTQLGDDGSGLRFSTEKSALLVDVGPHRPVIEIDAAELWTWVMDKQLPASLSGFETCFGVPKFLGAEGYILRITFAASNVDDPRSWGVPPACLAEWSANHSAVAKAA